MGEYGEKPVISNHIEQMNICCHPYWGAKAVCQRHQESILTAAECCLDAWATNKEYGFRLEEYASAQRAFAKDFLDSTEPYDALLHFNEPELNYATVQTHIKTIGAALPELILESLQLAKKRGVASLSGHSMEEVIESLACETGFLSEGGRLEWGAATYSAGSRKSAFVSLAPGKPEEVLRALLHELGHSRYVQSVRSDYDGLPEGIPVSSVLQEGGALLYEKIIGGSEVFCQRISRLLSSKDVTGCLATKFLLQDLLFLASTMTRISLEQALISQEDTDIPSLWSTRYRELCGGMVLADFHPARFCPVEGTYGLFGYAPAYFLGMIFAAEVALAKEKAIESGCRGDWKALNAWMAGSFWSEGSRVRNAESQSLTVFGKGLCAKNLLRFLRKRLRTLSG